MFEEQDPTPEPPSHGRRTLIIAAIAVAAVAIAAAWVVPMLRGRDEAPGAPAASAPAPPPRTEPAPATPEARPEAPRPARPRPAKKAEPAPAPAAPAAPTTGELHIDSDVAGAMVFLDRKYVGNTPATATDVTPGTHHLNVSAEGYDGYSDTIEVAPGAASVMVRFKEIRLNASVDVVHKHAFGSCEGRLVADPQGIRYETTNRNDAFSMKWADIETFKVDYLKKILVIKKRGGRQYNFTTRAPNADPLFVFHRDVDKVRQQVTGATGR